MTTPTSIQSANGPLEYVVTGDGTPLLALHGGMGGHDQSMLLARALMTSPSRCRVIAVSRPGYLGTPLSVGASPEEQADLYAVLLDKLGIESVAVAAVSAGGPSALQFAIRHPARCRALILVSTCTGRLVTPPRILKRMAMMTSLVRIPGLTQFLRWRVRRNPDAAATRAIPDAALRAQTVGDPGAGPLLHALQLSVFDRLPSRLPGTINDITRFETLDAIDFGKIAAPTLVVHGRGDDIVPFAHAEAAARGIHGAELLGFDGAGHVALFTHMKDVREKASRYLA